MKPLVVENQDGGRQCQDGDHRLHKHLQTHSRNWLLREVSKEKINYLGTIYRSSCMHACVPHPHPHPSTVTSSKSKNKKSLFRSSQPTAEDAAIAAAAARIPQESGGGGGGGRRKKRGSFLFKKNNNNNNTNEPETPATAESPWRSPGQDTRRSNDDILAEINHLVDESADSESMNNLVITTTNDHHVDDMSLMTDEGRMTTNVLHNGTRRRSC